MVQLKTIFLIKTLTPPKKTQFENKGEAQTGQSIHTGKRERIISSSLKPIAYNSTHATHRFLCLSLRPCPHRYEKRKEHIWHIQNSVTSNMRAANILNLLHAFF